MPGASREEDSCAPPDCLWEMKRSLALIIPLFIQAQGGSLPGNTEQTTCTVRGKKKKREKERKRRGKEEGRKGKRRERGICIFEETIKEAASSCTRRRGARGADLSCFVNKARGSTPVSTQSPGRRMCFSGWGGSFYAAGEPKIEATSVSKKIKSRTKTLHFLFAR